MHKILTRLLYQALRIMREIVASDTFNVLAGGRKVHLRSYSEPWADSTSPAGELMFTIATAFAAFERSLIRESVKAGLDRARKQGKTLGRPCKVNGEFAVLRAQIRQGSLTQAAAGTFWIDAT